MPRKSPEEKQKLEQTRITLDEVKRTLVADLKQLNEDDYERLDVEMELNKLEQQRRKNNIDKESKWIWQMNMNVPHHTLLINISINNLSNRIRLLKILNINY